MGKVNFIQYQQEFEQLGIGELLYGLIIGICEQIVGKYPPNQYPPYYSTWDIDAVHEVAHEFMITWLLKAGRLEYYLYSDLNSDSFERIIREELRRFMINNRRKSEFSNLFKRTQKILREANDFASFAVLDRNNALWGLAGWDKHSIATSHNEVLDALWQVDVPPLIKYRPDSKKTSHLLSDVSLKRLLIEFFTNLQKKVDLVTLMQAMMYRLGLIEISERSLTEILAADDESTLGELISTSEPSIDSYMIAEEAANEVYEILSDRQRKILAQFLISSNGTLKEISEALNLSKSTVHNELQIIENLVRNIVQEPESESVFAKLSELCVKHTANGEPSV
jgi:hypothetical protein